MMAAVGWLGTLLYLLAQVLLAVFDLSKFRYILLNALAAFAVSVYSLAIWSLQPVFINVVWTLLSLAGLRYRHGMWRPFGGAVQVRRQSPALIAAGCAAFAAGWLVWRPELWFWLSWLSFWLYSASYLCFIFVGLGRRAFFALCILAAAAIIPQLLIDGNHPVLVVQVLWIVFSAVGLVRRDLAV